jgi:hypothetical protein
MSEIRVDKIQAHEGTISFTGITTFSGSGAFGLPGGNTAKRPEVPKEGQVRYINGDVKKGLEFYNGTDWITVGVANGDIVEGATPIGVFGGGSSTNIIDYITIATTGNATDFGDLLAVNNYGGMCSSSTRGVYGGGAGVGTRTNVIQYVTITSTGNAADFGDLAVSGATTVADLSACSSSTRGVFAGGTTVSAPTLTFTNVIQYITIATIGNSTDFGDLTSPARAGLSACSSSTRGVFGGGYTPTNVNTIDYITIATTGNAQTFGQLFQPRRFLSACSSSTRGVFGGGASPTIVNTIDFITIASQGTNASTFGQLSQARSELAACSSSTRGIFGGGRTPTNQNTIDYITIATTGNATDFGDLTQPRSGLAACSNSHGGLLTS